MEGAIGILMVSSLLRYNSNKIIRPYFEVMDVYMIQITQENCIAYDSLLHMISMEHISVNVGIPG